MPTLVVENVPLEVYERLEQRAAARQRTLPEETLQLLQQALREDASRTPRLPDFLPGEELSAPCDLPRSSLPEPIPTGAGRPRLQGALTAEAPE